MQATQILPEKLLMVSVLFIAHMVQYFSHMSKANIESLLKSAFNPTYLNVIDDSAKHAGHAGAKQGGHYHVIIKSPAFDGKKTIDIHRMIYAAVAPTKDTIHALSMEVKR